MKDIFFVVLFPFFFVSMTSVVLAEEDQRLLFDAPSQNFAITPPVGWDVDQNTMFYESGWIVSLYDDVEHWNVQIDISQQTTDLQFINTKKQTIVENLFVSYYNVCQNDTFDIKLFENLSFEFRNLLDKHHRQQLTEGITETTDIVEWWSDLTENEIGLLLRDEQTDASEYLTGDMCSDFTPIDYQIIENEDYIQYRIFYTWTQTFPNDTYFENYSQINKFGIENSETIYIITISSLSTINQFKIHNESVETVIDSLELLETRPSIPSEIPSQSKINMGLWANNQTLDNSFKFELEWLINSNIIPVPSIATNFDEIEITFVPEWLKKPTNLWYNQELSDVEYVQLISDLLERNIIEFKIISD